MDAVKPANPFMEQSSQLSNLAREQFGPMASQVCVSGATWREIPPATFTLGPNHSVVIKDSSITVAYNGTENRIMTGLLPGAVSMPMRYTPLDVSRPVVVRRHFLQWFVWVPDVPAAPSTWSLGWILHEVVGGQFTIITGERSLAIVAGAEPPASYDAARLAHVRVNADGEAEWVIAGSTPAALSSHEGSEALGRTIRHSARCRVDGRRIAQNGTADGVAALARATFSRRPILAHRRGMPARSGGAIHGVPHDRPRRADELRACAYHRASNSDDNP